MAATKIWNGTAWVDPTSYKIWNGSAWVDATATTKVWSGSTWVDVEGGVVPPDSPTTDFWCSFDAGAEGATVKTTDTGQGVVFNSVSSPAPTYAYPGKSGQACAQVVTSLTTTSYMQWNASAMTSGRVGFWFKPGAVASAEARILDLRQTSTAGTVGGLLWMPTGVLRLMVNTSGVSAASSPALTLGQWYWVSLGWDATAKTARYVVYTSTGVLFYDSGSVSVAASTYANFATARFGAVTVGTYGTSQWDECQFDAGSAVPLDPWLP
jgi:hypothetical protein